MTSSLKKTQGKTLVNRVRASLERMTDVKEKKIFGSVGFMVRGNLCVGVRPERIMCRIDPLLHDTLVKRKGCKTVVMGGRKYRGYVYVAKNSVKTARALNYWLGLALNYNMTLKVKRGRA